MFNQKTETAQDTTQSTAGADKRSASSAPKGWIEWGRCMLYDTLVAPLALSRHPPWYDARGVSIGLVVGFGVPVGVQTLSLVFLRSLFRFNLVIALGLSFVSNPLNMVPLYYGYYCLGAFVLGKNTAMDFSVFQNLMHPISNSSYFWEATAAFVHLSEEFLASWIVAAIILSVTFGLLGYAVTYKIQQTRCTRKAKKMGLDYEKFLQDLEKQFRQRECSLPTRIEKNH